MLANVIPSPVTHGAEGGPQFPRSRSWSASRRPSTLELFGSARPLRYTIRDQAPDDETATAQTIALMAHFAREDSKSELIRTITHQAVSAAPFARNGDAGSQARAIFDWIRTHIRFGEDAAKAAELAGVTDPALAEVLIRPVDLVTMPHPTGDCDDFSMLAAAMLLAVGIEPAFQTIAADRAHPDLYSHVYTLAFCPEGAYALDASHGQFFGWRATAQGKQRTWPVLTGGSKLSGLRAIDWGSILTTGVSTAANIAQQRYGQPPPGTYRQTGDDIFYRQPPNSGPFSFPGATIGTGPGIGTLLLIVAGLAAVVMIAKR
jgi:hypothetical protein